MASVTLGGQFQYQRIGKDDIRLLTWPRKAPHEDHETINLWLVTVPRSKAPTYTALSYEWTQHAASEPIYIDRQCFLVRPNLYNCLKRLRERRGIWEYVWIDALCIDQGNVSERNDQVQKMASTYRDASTVVAWLGNDIRVDSGHWKPPVEYTAAETDYFAKPMDESDTVKMYGPPSGSRLQPDLPRRANYKPMSPCRGHAIKLLDLSYWTRKWIVQELHLARRVDFLWGRFSFTWEDICWIVDKYTYRLPIEEGLYDPATVDERTWFVGKRSPARAFLDTMYLRLPENPGLCMPLEALLTTHDESVCSDPRDRIFALLGILPQEEQRIFAPFFPDYTSNHCLVALIVCSYLKQTDWRGNDDGKTYERLGYRKERDWEIDCAGFLDLERDEMLRFFEISNYYEELVAGSDAGGPMQLSPAEPSQPALSRQGLIQRLDQGGKDNILKVLTEIARSYADFDWSEFPSAWSKKDSHADCGSQDEEV